MNSLKHCYNKIHDQIGQDIEPFESVALVDRYRQYWKPNKTKIILLAESHVFTSDEDRSIKILVPESLPNYPSNYAKFVYCLGYGERELTDHRRHPPRDGTPQFWKLFYSCNNPVSNNLDFKPILKLTSYEERLSNKIDLLLALKQKGIWLVDSSIIALYNRSKKNERMRDIIKISWNYYIKDLILATDPQYLICIGKGVYNILHTELETYFKNRYHVMSQPQARLKSKTQMSNWIKYNNICNKYT